jgi:hypothetical protein
MTKFVLKRQRSSQAIGAGQIRKLDGVRVLDEFDDLVLLVEAEPDTLDRHRADLAGWTIAEETAYPVPTSHPTARSRRNGE